MARAATLGPNDGSKLYLDRVLQLSKRKSGIQLPIGFVRSAWQPRSYVSPSSASTAEPVVTPLVAMLRGGHGGEVRLKLYLSITLLAAHPPFDISRPIAGRSWATMLGLPDPEGNGARRIADALVWLDQHRYIALQRRPGMPPVIVLRNPLGDGSDYARPTMPYVGLRVGYWQQQWITALSGTATALLLVLIDLTHGKGRYRTQSVSAEQRRQYALSADSWARASKELVRLGLLETGRGASGRDLEWRRARTTYTLLEERLDEPPPMVELE